MAIRNFKDKQPQIGEGCYIDESAIIIGDVVLADNVSVWPMAVIRGDVSHIRVGEGSNIQDGCVLHVSHDSPHAPGEHPLEIGQGVTIGHKAVVHACKVGDNCLIGVGAIVMDDAVIEDYVILGAGALVPPGKTLESGHLYVGAPAKQVRPLKDSEKEFLDYSHGHYAKLKDEYLAQD